MRLTKIATRIRLAQESPGDYWEQEDGEWVWLDTADGDKYSVADLIIYAGHELDEVSEEVEEDSVNYSLSDFEDWITHTWGSGLDKPKAFHALQEYDAFARSNFAEELIQKTWNEIFGD